MRGKRVELTGLRFEHLLVIEHNPRKTKGCMNSQWLCRCDCGKYLIVRHDNLTSGRTTECSDCHCGAGRKSVFVERVMKDGVV